MTVTALFAATPERLLTQCIATLGRTASIEINVQDSKHLAASRAWLPAGKKIYVSHLPKQRWEDTIDACKRVRAAGFDPVPHIPVRLLPDRAALDRLLAMLTGDADVREVLLISGDYAKPVGEYSTVLEVLRTDLLQRHGLTRVSLAGHPEGHPRVALEAIRRAEIDKALYAQQAGLEATLLTQFCFEATPFIDWARELESAGVRAALIAGIAGPAKLATLVNFALRCGVGRSIRALGARPGVINLLMTEHAPEDIIRELARAIQTGETRIAGLHFFCFGGYVRTCEWLSNLG